MVEATQPRSTRPMTALGRLGRDPALGWRTRGTWPALPLRSRGAGAAGLCPPPATPTDVGSQAFAGADAAEQEAGERR